MPRSEYLDSKNGTLRNAVHWVLDPLDPDVVLVLRRIDEAGRLRDRDRLNIAYLVARGCLRVAHDVEPMTFQITPKGYDALAYYA